MIPKKSNKRVRLWTTPTFKQFLWEKKAEAPNKTLMDIQDEITTILKEHNFKPKNEKKKPKYESPFFPKL